MQSPVQDPNPESCSYSRGPDSARMSAALSTMNETEPFVRAHVAGHLSRTRTAISQQRLLNMDQDEFQRNRFTFLISEARTGIMFCNIALSATDNIEMRKRNIFNARRSYDQIAHSRRGLILTESQEAELNKAVNKLRKDLSRLGEPLSAAHDSRLEKL